jgi:hypothetical protein
MCAALTALEVLVALGHGALLTVGAGAQASLDAASPRRSERFSQGMCRTNELASAVDAEASSMCE